MMAKTLLITGGTGKVGKQFVKFFLSQQCKVVITSRSNLNVLEFLEQLDKKEYLDSFHFIQVDLEDKSAANVIIKWCEQNETWPDVLINNARNIDYLKMENGYVPYENWHGEFNLDVIVPYNLTMKFISHTQSILKNVINISSMYGIVPPNPSLYEDFHNQSPIHYGVAKAALIHLTKELSVRLSDRKIQVNTISFGGVEGRVNEDFKKKYGRLCPMGRMLKEEEVIGAVQFLASDYSAGITGHNLVVDGGWSVW
ncbi:SDR family oxidoreductase [Cytobacillus dafuensis]|uniref:SDR family oxidoreductase n=1 Tax=Cytobacillus dafuensis TaxID=1742359 RepID=A0A5B8Z8B0_CYTDA|nr:SDR family oxidoreductase [Cytobacillus dafuensis]QED49194.1 SDR family oxidoreductase [Cytobacillus dafuensis]